MSILSIAQDAALHLSLPQPSALVSSSDQTALRLMRHITAACRALARDYDWTVLKREKTFTTTAAEEQTGAIPTDFLRFIPETFFNRTTTRRVNGPLTSEEWQGHKAALTTYVDDAFRIRGTSLLIAPTPPAGETMAYEYITKNIGTNSAGDTDRLSFTDDTDLTFLNEDLLILEVVWRFRQADGLDYAEDFRSAQLAAVNLQKMDGGRRRLSMDDNKARVPMPPRVPDTLVFP